MPAYKDKVRGTWTARFYYKDFTGKSVPKNKRGFKRKSDALKFEREFIEKYEGSSNMTYQSLYEIYMEMIESDIKPTTLKNKKASLKNHVLPYFKDFKITEIKSINITDWQGKMKKKGLKEGTLKTIQLHFSASLNFAVKHYKLPGNPIVLAGPIVSAPKYASDFWTLDEFNKAMSCLKEGDPFRLIFTILFFSGLRTGELLALTLNDFDFENLTVTIDKTYIRQNELDIISDPKTPSSTRKITLPASVVADVKSYTDRLYGLKSDERIFSDFTTHTIRRKLYGAAKEMGLKQIKLHDLRHSHASLLIKLNTPVKAVSKRLGHMDVGITLNRYSHLYPDEQKNIADGLNDLIETRPKHDHD